VRVGFESGLVAGEKERRIKGKGEYKKAWLWVAGGGAGLRAGGDLVEKRRYGIDR